MSKQINLYEFSKQIHKDNIKNGFYDGNENETILNTIHRQLLLIITEVAEAAEYTRKHKIDNSTVPQINNVMLEIDVEWKKTFEKLFKDSFQDEIADTIIRIFDLLGYLDIDIQPWIDAKLQYNKTREYKHGKIC